MKRNVQLCLPHKTNTLYIFGWALLLLLTSLFQSTLLTAASPQDLTQQEKETIAYVEAAIAKGARHISLLSADVLQMEGMSSPKVRHFLNNLCSKPNTHYLEIGCWKGSTLVSSLFNNDITVSSATAIDNWISFSGPKKEFQENCRNFLSGAKLNFYEVDCFKINPKDLCNFPITTYFYDGEHTELDQELAFVHYNDVFADLFIAVIDDWNHPPVQKGTRNAFAKLNYQILFEAILPSNFNGDTENWWNGLYVAVIRK
jgi:hypothetical protein